jgi:hypothetical protein
MVQERETRENNEKIMATKPEKNKKHYEMTFLVKWIDKINTLCF